MKKTTTLFAAVMGMTAICLAASAQGTPKIKFDRLVYDFGKTSQVETVTGVFKFSNIGDGILKLEAPKPSCGCTLAELKPDTLKPGESGELPFTLHLGQVKAQFDKVIVVKSNDPKTPEISLSIKADYTPLYDVNPMTLSPSLGFGTNETFQFTTITRTDGKPIRSMKFVTSQPWISAAMQRGAKADDSVARVRISIRREGSPRRFNEYVHVYGPEQTNTPVSSIYIYGNVMGEVSLSPEALYWSIIDGAKPAAEGAESSITKRVTIRSNNGKPFELKNPQSTIKGIKVEVVPKEAGKVYELVARLDDVPAGTVSGNVSFETSVAAQSRIEVPVIVNISKP